MVIMKTLYLLFALALMYFGWSLSSWEISVGYGDDSAGPVPPRELLTVEGLPR
jgi:hypothetical protein